MTDNLKRVIIQCVQGSEEWFAARLGIVTASRFKDVLNSGAGRGMYMKCLADEKRKGIPYEGYQSNAMKNGHTYEPFARQFYEDKYGVTVEQVGFVRWGQIGCSPDGLVGDDGGVEIKCSEGKSHREILKKQKMPVTHIPQVQGNMWVADLLYSNRKRRKWWDFISYTPFPQEQEEPFYCTRIERDDNYIDNILAPACERFLQDLNDLNEILKGAKDGQK